MKLSKPVLLSSLAILCLLLTSGCNPLRSKQPLGDHPVILKANEINGTWFWDGGFLQIRVTDADKGEVLAAFIDEKQSDFKLEKLKVVLRRTGDTMFVNLWHVDDKTDTFLVGRGKLTERSLVFWHGSEQPLQEAFRNGRLSVVATNNLTITTNFSKAAELLSSPQGAGMFDLDTPIVLTRMPK